MRKINQKIIIEKLKKERKNLKEKRVKRIGLFGSYAKDKQKKGSDIDFLVEFEDINADNFVGALFFLEKLFGKKVDLVEINSLRKELNYLKKEIEYVKI